MLDTKGFGSFADKPKLQTNRTNGRPVRKVSAATLAKQSNQLDDIEMLDDARVMMVFVPDWAKGKVSDKKGEKHTYTSERKFEIGAEDAIKREDGAQLIAVRSSLVYATPDYVAERSQSAEVKRWKNLAAAIGKGLADASSKGVTVEQVQEWIDKADSWLFRRYDGSGVQMCDVDDKGAVRYVDVPSAQQKTIQNHLAKARKLVNGGVGDDAAGDVHAMIASLERLLANEYSDAKMAELRANPSLKAAIPAIEAGRDAYVKELDKLKRQRDREAKKSAAKAAKGGK